MTSSACRAQVTTLRSSFCYCKSFPDSDNAKTAKKPAHIKEGAARTWLQDRYGSREDQSLKLVFDLHDSGTRLRPDHRPPLRMLGITSHDVIMETDENSHWWYDCQDEREKEADMHYWLSERKKPLIWIRFNPDASDDPATANVVPSCFRVGKDSVTRFNPKQANQWEERLKKLCQVRDDYLVDLAEEWADIHESVCEFHQDNMLTIELFYENVALKQFQIFSIFLSNVRNKTSITITISKCFFGSLLHICVEVSPVVQ